MDCSDEERPWPHLPLGILEDIASRFEDTFDVAYFALVSPNWKVASYSNRLHPSKAFPWLLIPERTLRSPEYYRYHHTDPRSGRRRFFRPPDKLFDWLFPAACGRRCLGSGSGWLLMLAADDHITMVSPFTGASFPLPLQSTLKFPSVWRDEEKYRSYISKIVIGKDDSGRILALAIAGDRRNLAIARPTDRKWTPVRCKWSRITDAIFHHGRIYAVDNRGMLVSCNETGLAERIADPPNYKLPRRQRHYWYILVSSSGSLLLVVRVYDREQEPLTIQFKVFELLREEARWMPIEDLGDQALFLGYNTSTSVKASAVSDCEANFVYFSEDCIGVYRNVTQDDGGGYDTGKYNLKDGCVVMKYYAGVYVLIHPLFGIFHGYHILAWKGRIKRQCGKGMNMLSYCTSELGCPRK